MFREISSYSRVNKYTDIHPLEKVIIAILPIVVLGFCKNYIIIILNIVLFTIMHSMAKNPRRIVLKFAGGASIFAIISSITMIFDIGIKGCAIIILKTFSGGMCVSFLVLTTSMSDILFLMSKHKLLLDLCDIIKTMERFLFLLEEEFNIMYLSMKSRGGFESFKSKISNTGKMAGLLFINTSKRWLEIKDGINSRGFSGKLYYGKKYYRFSVCRTISSFSYIVLLIFLNYKY